MDYKFYICKHCGNIITMVKDCGVPVVCCGEKMHELVPCSTQAAVEKHMPVYKIDGNNVFVTVGENAHPMQEEHYIQWVALVTKQGLQVKILSRTKTRMSVLHFRTATRLRQFTLTAIFTVCGKFNVK